MNVQHTNSITGPGSQASARVASSLTARPAVTSTKTGTTKPMAAASTSSATSDASDITSSDFLTLLVSELQNQDPTQPADPNAYISQLVGVNSLQQLIQINTGITSLDSSASSAASSAASGSGSSANSVSGSNTNANAVANTLTSADSAPGTYSVTGQNSIWGGGTTS
jgi:flagellar basal-body rod modification protein FlgD